MIRVEVTEVSGRITEFTLSGHAGYADSGRDIVCAAVSMLVINAVNSCEGLLGVALPAEAAEGFLHSTVPMTERDAEVQLLLHSMLFGLNQVQEQHPDFVDVRKFLFVDKE